MPLPIPYPPSRLKIEVVADLAGVAVRVSCGPSAFDPMAQNGMAERYPDAALALADIPDLCRLFLADLVKEPVMDTSAFRETQEAHARGEDDQPIDTVDRPDQPTIDGEPIGVGGMEIIEDDPVEHPELHRERRDSED
jgi:hypothetical protein